LAKDKSRLGKPSNFKLVANSNSSTELKNLGCRALAKAECNAVLSTLILVANSSILLVDGEGLVVVCNIVDKF
jgi:hypothetical protein